MVNIRQKGFDAERQVAELLNAVVNSCYTELGLPVPTKPVVQRNQNQSAVGGKDLVGTFGLDIEVKRHETLAINTWWRQCQKSANESGGIPVLIFRQSRQQWRVITNGYLISPYSLKRVEARCEVSFDDFTSWFRVLVLEALRSAAEGRGVQQNGLFDQ